MAGDDVERAIGHYLLDQGPHVVVAADVSGRVRYVNRRFSEVTGWSAEEATGLSLEDLAGEGDPGLLQEMRRRVGAGREWRGELLARKRSGETYWEFASVTPVRGPDGRTVFPPAPRTGVTEANSQ